MSINDLADSDFAYIEPGGTKDAQGRTTPRSLRHFPIHDEAHVRNALARLSQSPFEAQARPKVEAAAKRMGIGAPAEEGKARHVKALGELKAEPMDETQLDRWLSGRIPRRVLAVPFGGPLPGGKAGLDLDGEYFDAETDLYGPFPALRQSRERLVDWHHDEMYRKLGSVGDPTGRMKGAILGRIVLDEKAEGDGLWADFWANAGEERLALIKRLETRGVPLYGSSQAARGAWRKADDGHIEVWPIIRHTITTSPQNTFAVVPPLKAVLSADLSFDDVGVAALKAAIVGLEDLGDDLRATSSGGERVARARRLSGVLDEAEGLLPRLRARIATVARN